MSLSRRAGRAGGRASEPSRGSSRGSRLFNAQQTKPSVVFKPDGPNRGGPEPRRSRTEVQNRGPEPSARAKKKIPKKSHDATDGTTRGPEPRTGADPPPHARARTRARPDRVESVGHERWVVPSHRPRSHFENIYLHHGPDVRGTRSLFHIFNPSLSVCPYVRVRQSVGPSAAVPTLFRPSPGANGERACLRGGSNQ